MKELTDKDLTLSIDIGGTNTAFGIIDADGNILCRGTHPTTGHASFKDYIKTMRQSVEVVLNEAGIDYNRLAAIGVGAPCLNCETGVIEGAVNLPWPSPLPLTQELTETFALPAVGDNDANAAALGEMCFGAVKGLDNFIMITLGTGVGSAIICDGHLLRGHRGLAGELGHTIIRRGSEGRKCNCGRSGCLDTYVSAGGVVRTARELLDDNSRHSSLRSVETLDAKSVGEAAAAGDELAQDVFRFTGEILGEACADFAAISSPKAFVFFGGVANAFPLFEQSLRESYRKNLLWVYDSQVEFVKSTLPLADAALLGAAASARVRLKL